MVFLLCVIEVSWKQSSAFRYCCHLVSMLLSYMLCCIKNCPSHTLVIKDVAFLFENPVGTMDRLLLWVRLYLNHLLVKILACKSCF